jgi:hypothetical protein
MARQKEKHTSYNTAYLVTAFIQKPSPIFASATLRQTSDMPKRSATSLRSVAECAAVPAIRLVAPRRRRTAAYPP